MALSLCNITGSIADSSGTLRDATLITQAKAPIIDDGTDPATIITPARSTFTITDGVLDIDLPQSEGSRVAYVFQLTVTETSPGADDGYYLEFETVVPDQATADFASLLPTTFTTDRSATGALRIAQEMLTNERLVPYLIEGLGIIRQSTVPGTPDNVNQVWLNTSNGIWHTWEASTSKWKSEVFWERVNAIDVEATDVGATTIYYTPITNPLQAPFIRVRSVHVRYVVQATPNDGLNKWSLRGGYRQASSATITAIGTSVESNQGGYAVGTLSENLVTPSSTVLTPDTADHFALTLTKTGSPAAINFSTAFAVQYLF